MLLLMAQQRIVPREIRVAPQVAVARTTAAAIQTTTLHITRVQQAVEEIAMLPLIHHIMPQVITMAVAVIITIIMEIQALQLTTRTGQTHQILLTQAITVTELTTQVTMEVTAATTAIPLTQTRREVETQTLQITLQPMATTTIMVAIAMVPTIAAHQTRQTNLKMDQIPPIPLQILQVQAAITATVTMEAAVILLTMALRRILLLEALGRTVLTPIARM